MPTVDAATGERAWVQRAGSVMVFAKAPRAGLVKTRMSPPLTPEQAAALYGHMLDDVLEATAQIAHGLDLDAVLCVYPAESCAEIAHRVPVGFRVIAQRGAGLGERMGHAAAEAAAAGAQRILLRGSDNPLLSRSHFEEALAELEDHDLVISPDRDGGYGLVGMRSPQTGLFDHPMSTGSVLEETMANAGQLGLGVKLLERSFDLDTAADLRLLARARDAGEADSCPRTLAYLDGADVWSRIEER
jgi:rSAM/selenodomain-associated transferase 1